jgi:hypothetical protein
MAQYEERTKHFKFKPFAKVKVSSLGIVGKVMGRKAFEEGNGYLITFPVDYITDETDLESVSDDEYESYAIVDFIQKVLLKEEI